MKKFLLIAADLILCLPVHGQERSTAMNDVTIWYDAFNKRDAALAQKVLSKDWIDIPTAPGHSGPEGRRIHPRRPFQGLSRFPDHASGDSSGWKQSCRPLKAHRYTKGTVHGLSR